MPKKTRHRTRPNDRPRDKRGRFVSRTSKRARPKKRTRPPTRPARPKKPLRRSPHRKPAPKRKRPPQKRAPKKRTPRKRKRAQKKITPREPRFSFLIAFKYKSAESDRSVDFIVDGARDEEHAQELAAEYIANNEEFLWMTDVPFDVQLIPFGESKAESRAHVEQR